MGESSTHEDNNTVNHESNDKDGDKQMVRYVDPIDSLWLCCTEASKTKVEMSRELLGCILRSLPSFFSRAASLSGSGLGSGAR